MSYSITTNKAKEKLVKARAGAINLPPIAKMYFGKGGINGSNIVVECTPEQVELKDKIFEKDIDGYKFTDFNKCEYSCTLDETELADEGISEIALVDRDGDIVAIKNFSIKNKDGDMKMRFEIVDEF